MPRIYYRSFSFVPPEIISESDFIYHKSNTFLLDAIDISLMPYTLVIEFLKTFWWGLLITFGLLAVMAGNDMPSEAILYIVGIVAGITIILPLITYSKYVNVKKEYYETLKYAVINSDTFLDFCKKMKNIDERYYKFID